MAPKLLPRKISYPYPECSGSDETSSLVTHPVELEVVHVVDRRLKVKKDNVGQIVHTIGKQIARQSKVCELLLLRYHVWNYSFPNINRYFFQSKP